MYSHGVPKVLRREVLSLKDVADILFRQQALMLAGVVSIVAVTVTYLALARPTYSSEMLMLVKNDRPNPMLVPNQGLGISTRGEVTESQMATEVDLLASQELLTEVVQKCNLVEYNAGNDRGTQLQDAIKTLQKRLKITPGMNSDLIKLTYRSGTPQGAVHVLQVVANSYLDRNLKINRVAGGTQFFHSQSDRYAKQLRDTQEKMAEFEMRTKVVVLDEQKDLKLQKLSDLESTLQQTETAQQEAQERNIAIKKQMSGVLDRITTQSRAMPNQYSAERLNTLLVELRNKRTELLAKFRPDDRMIQELDDQIAQTDVALTSAKSAQIKDEATDVNPIHQTLESELLQSENRIAGLRARSMTLKDQVADYRHDLDRLELVTAEHNDLARNVKEAESRYLLYSRQFEQAKIAAEMDRQRMANVIVAEGPSFPLTAEKRVSPPVVFGAFLGILGWIGLLFLSGLRRKQVFTPWELEGILAFPVLGAIPSRKDTFSTTHSTLKLLAGGQSKELTQ